MWTDFFGGIYLINLPQRTDRLEQSTAELNRYNITFTVIPAIKKLVGSEGLLLTMKQIFDSTTAKNKPVLIFEDDVKIITDPAPIMEKVVQVLYCHNWDTFHLGPNTHQDFGLLEHGCMLQLFNAYSTHAVAYSPLAQDIIREWKWANRPVDVMIAEKLQVLGCSYCSYPMIATQRNGFSDIDNKDVTYDYIEERYIKHTKHLRYITV